MRIMGLCYVSTLFLQLQTSTLPSLLKGFKFSLTLCNITYEECEGFFFWMYFFSSHVSTCPPAIRGSACSTLGWNGQLQLGDI